MGTPTTARWGDGDAISGTPFRVLVAGKEVDNRLVVLSADMPPGLHVDEHTHDNEDQITIVVRGRVGARIGSTEVVIEAGGLALLPRGIPHTQWNAGNTVAQVLEIYTPSGFEQVFARLGATHAPADR